MDGLRKSKKYYTHKLILVNEFSLNITDLTNNYKHNYKNNLSNMNKIQFIT